MSTLIKICGIRRKEDCGYINEAMPDYAGFIFWEHSFRYIDKGKATELRSLINKDIKTVGVFVDAEICEILDIVMTGAIDVVQLHGNEDEDYIKKLRESSGIPIWKAFKVRSDEDIEAAVSSSADMVLLDNGYGTGECFNHGLLRDVGRDYILAGGLNPENIEEIRTNYSPYMLDLSSGVETDKYKDRDKIIKAVKAARGEEYT